MNYLDTYKYPLEFYNSKYLTRVANQYICELHTYWKIVNAIEFVINHKAREVNLNITDGKIIDKIPLIYKEYLEKPALLFEAIISPTFGLSLFHTTNTTPKQDKNLNTWCIHMKNLHTLIASAIENKTSLQINDDKLDINELYRTYDSIYDKNLFLTYHDDITGNCFLSVALMDIYFMFHREAPFEPEELRFDIKYLFQGKPNSLFLHHYNTCLQITPPSENISFFGEKKMPFSYFENMKQQYLKFVKIHTSLGDKRMSEVEKKSKAVLNTYNEACYHVMNNYCSYLSSVFSTSPLIQNKNHCLYSLNKYTESLEKDNAAACMIYFEHYLNKLIEDNLITQNLPFHFYNEKYNLYSSVPELIDIKR